MSNQGTCGEKYPKIEIPQAFRWMKGGKILPTPLVRNFDALKINATLMQLVFATLMYCNL